MSAFLPDPAGVGPPSRRSRGRPRIGQPPKRLGPAAQVLATRAARVVAALLLMLAGAASLRGAIVREDFAADPANRGWEVSGNASLFEWDAAGGRLGVTWDSTQTNSFFLRPLGTVLARTDDVRFAFTLVLDELRTDSPDTTFLLAFGLLRRNDTRATNYFRGAGLNPAWGPRSLLEFDYFPASRSITPTFSAVAVGTNNLRWAMANLFPCELTPGDRYRIHLAFTAADQTLRLAIERNGESWCSGSTRLDDRFGDFRLDAFSVTSYSGDHQPAGYGGGLFARGWIDDLEIEHPDPPAPRLALVPGTGPETVRFVATAVPGWTPSLERSIDWTRWEPTDAAPAGTGPWTFVDPSPPAGHAVYRLRLERP